MLNKPLFNFIFIYFDRNHFINNVSLNGFMGIKTVLDCIIQVYPLFNSLIVQSTFNLPSEFINFFSREFKIYLLQVKYASRISQLHYFQQKLLTLICVIYMQWCIGHGISLFILTLIKILKSDWLKQNTTRSNIMLTY